MISFYIGAAILIFLGLVFALWPIIAKKSTETRQDSDIVEREEVNVALYKDHLDELEKSLAEGNIDQEQFDSLKQEVERNLLEDSDLDHSDANDQNDTQATLLNHAKTHLFYTAVAFVLVPVMAIVLYQYLGNFVSWNLQSKLEEKTTIEMRLSAEPQSLELKSQLTAISTEIAFDLQKHLEGRPDDLDSRVLLARTAVDLQDYDLAINHYQHVLEKAPEASQIMAELAQAIFVKAGNQVVPVVPMLASRALNIDSKNVIALGLMGISDFQQGKYQQAIDYWNQAVAIYPPNSANGLALQGGIDEAKARLAADPSVAVSAPVSAATSETAAKMPDNHGDAAVSKIKVAVSLADTVPAKPEYTVFVYARAWQGARLPLAITRITAAQLPITLELNDTMNMAPGLNLSSADQVEVIARVSPSGNAITQADDWLVSIGPINPKTASTTVYPLVISSPVSSQ